MSPEHFVLGGPGGPPDQDQRLDIVCGRGVALNPDIAVQIVSASPGPEDLVLCLKAEDAEGLGGNGTGSRQLDKFQRRAALLGQFLSLVYGKSTARLSVVEALMAALNENTLSLSGDTTDSALNQQIADALAGKDGLTKSERLSIERSQASSIGIASFVVALSEPVLASATAVAALSCEALRAQIDAFEGQDGITSPYTHVSSVAQDLKGLLTGSTRVNHKRNTGSLYSIDSVPEIHGAAEAAREAAAATICAESAVRCPSRKDLERMRPSMQLLPKYLELGKSLRAAAYLSMARSSAYGTTAACFKGRLEALQAKASQLVHSAGEISVQGEAVSNASDAIEAWTLTPDLGAALLADDSLRLLKESINIEACLALIHLPKKADIAGETANKKKVKKKAAGLRTGVSELCAYLEGIVGDAAAQLAARQDQLSAASTSAAADGLPQPSEDSESDIENLLESVKLALDPIEGQLGILLAALEEVIQANIPKREPKVAKGARDFGPKEISIREPIFEVIKRVFKRHGGKGRETPVFERKDLFDKKIGEDSKLVYDLADQGGEILALRYDHTVPLARHVAQNRAPDTIGYTVGRVYRRDEHQPNRARWREFYQADFDMVGKYAPMVADAMVLKVLISILSELEIRNFKIKISHRKLLDAMLTFCGVPKQKFHPICSAIDKLDKMSWEKVRTEMIEEKGLPAEVADDIQQFTDMKGDMDTMIKELKARDWASRSAEAKEAADAALTDMELLSKRLKAMGADLCLFRFDLSLARGLDYYTGLIYEAVLDLPPGSEEENVGSIAAGGRYDDLVGQFSSKSVPCVGMSVGVERIFAILERRALKQAEELGASIRESSTQVLIISPGRQNLLQERLALGDELWQAEIEAECGIREENPGFMDEIKRAETEGIPILVIMGKNEIQKGIFKVQNRWRKKDDPEWETEVPQPQLLGHLLQVIAKNGSRNALFTKPTWAL